MLVTASEVSNMNAGVAFETISKLNGSGLLNGTMAGIHANSSDSSGLTQQEVENILRQQYVQEMSWSRFEGVEQTLIITFFTMLICVGSFGNGLVCFVVARNPAMRTPRNIFIINLAISDLTLCLFTQPFNLMKVLMTRWPLGEFMCKFVPMLAGTNVFVSTISITAIALDRFQVIVYPTKDSMKKVGAAVALLSIWLISILMASPLCIFNVIKAAEVFGFILYEACVENDKFFFAKGAYSVASMIFQYLVPILIVSVAHARICNKLKYRMVNQQSNSVSVQSPTQTQQRRSVLEKRRKRRTNTLLLMIGVVFVSSWMPLNIFNIMADFNHTLLTELDKKGLVFPICHMLVLCSACANPILYGWLNENFRREFVKVLCCINCRNPNRPFTVETRTRGQRLHVNVEETAPTSVALFTKPNATNGHTCTTVPTEETTVFINNTNSMEAC